MTSSPGNPVSGHHSSLSGHHSSLQLGAGADRFCRHSRSPVWARVTPRREAGLRLLALPWCPKLLFSLGHIHTASSAPRLCLLVADLKKSTSEQFDLWINYSGRERPLHSKHHTVFSGSDMCFSVCWFKLSSFVYQLSVLFSATSRSRSNF